MSELAESEINADADEGADEEADESDHVAPGAPKESGSPRRLLELRALLGSPEVMHALVEASGVLWRDPDTAWEPWLRRRYREAY